MRQASRWRCAECVRVSDTAIQRRLFDWVTNISALLSFLQQTMQRGGTTTWCLLVVHRAFWSAQRLMEWASQALRARSVALARVTLVTRPSNSHRWVMRGDCSSSSDWNHVSIKWRDNVVRRAHEWVSGWGECVFACVCADGNVGGVVGE